MYRFREDLDMNDLIDGRTIRYLSKKLHFNRENLSKILKGMRTCSYKRAEQIVSYCDKESCVDKYFVRVKKEG